MNRRIVLLFSLLVLAFSYKSKGQAPITGATEVCIGSTISVSSIDAGGTWTSSAPGVATIAPGGYTVNPVSPGNTVITYSSSAGVATTTITVNTKGVISGDTTVCLASTTTLSHGVGGGGTWTSSNTAAATIDGAGVVSPVTTGITVINYTNLCGVASSTMTVINAGTITGPPVVCLSLNASLSNGAGVGGTWSSSNPGIATIAAGGPGVVNPVALGTTVISYSNACAVATHTINVTNVGIISGLTSVCEGTTITLSNSSLITGSWSSSNSTLATVDPVTGVVTGGTPTGASSPVVIQFDNTCGVTTYNLDVFPAMQPIIAATTPTLLCSNNTFQLSDPVQGGTWSSSNNAVATVLANGSGTVYMVGAGSVVISYSTVCGSATYALTVNSSPSPVTGLNTFCVGSTGLLTATPGGGTWSSANTLIADVNISTGVVIGTGVGSACVSYTLSNGCSSVYCLVINNCPPCPVNSDFELGNYSNWKYYIGSCCNGAGQLQFPASGALGTPPTGTSGAGPHIPCLFALTGQVGAPGAVVTGTDPYGGFPVVGAGVYSLRIGSGRTNQWAEKAVYFVHVPTGPTQYSLIYQYAVVLEDPGHSAAQQPRFQVKAVNVTGVADTINGGTVVPCADFLYVPTGGLPGWGGPKSGTPPPGGAGCSQNGVGNSVYYKAWATTSINLSSVPGATIRMEFAAGGCQPTGHFAYGYVDMTCGTFAISNLSCGDSIATVTAPSGFANYAWYDSIQLWTIPMSPPPGPPSFGTTQTITFPTPSVPTTYAVVMTPYVNFGCPDTLYVRLRPSNLQLHPKPDTMICKGQSAQISVNATDIATPLTYSWAPVAGLSCATCANPVVTPNAGVNVYTVVVTNDAGCEKSGIQRVTVDSVAITTSSIATSCFGFTDGSVTATTTSGISPFGYSWTTVPAQVTSTAVGLAIGSYSVTVTDSLGCTTSGNATVTQPPALNMSIAGTSPPDSCDIPNGRIILAGDFTTGSTYTVSYLYMAAGASTTVAVTNTYTAGPDITITGLGEGIYDSIRIITNGCPYNTLGPVPLVDPLPPAPPYVNSNSPVCLGQPINFTTTSTTTGVTYTWSGPNGFTSAIQTPTITAAGFNDSGWYKVTVMVKNCYSSDSTKVRVVANPAPLAANNSPKCSDVDTIVLTSSNSNPGTGTTGDAFVWNGPDAFYSTFQNPILIHPAVTAAGAYTVEVTRDGCSAAAVTVVTVHPTPPAPDILDTNYCQLATAVPLSATGTNIRWYATATAALSDSIPVPTPNTNVPNIKTWYATQTSSTTPACTSVKAAVTVGVYALPDPKFTITDSVFCEGTYFTFAVTGENTGVDYQGLTWTFGPDVVHDVNPVLHSFSQDGPIDVIVNVNYKVCPDAELKHLVRVYPYPSLQLGDDTAICPGSEKLVIGDNKNDLDPAARWIWNTGEKTSKIDVVAPGTYYVKVTSNGCSTSDTIMVANDCYMNMPNVFTPNGDGVNDFFFPRQYLTRGLTSFSMTIYNRWGQVVFESKSIEGRGWDGTFNDVPQSQGVFIYVIDATFKDGQKEHHQGNITLLR